MVVSPFDVLLIIIGIYIDQALEWLCFWRKSC